MKSKISICFLTIVVILLALVMIEKINTQRAADKAAIIAQSNENDKEEKNEKESLFYTNITLDGRFITVGENNWDLRSRHKFDEVHIDMNDIYTDEDEESEEVEDDVDSTIEDDYNN